MIGIIMDGIGTYALLEEIRGKYPNLDIYLVNDENNINLLFDKGCNIIISIDEINKDIRDKYLDISFINLKDISIENGYVLDDISLIKAIDEGNNDLVIDILKNLNIPRGKTIILNNPKLLFIKSIINDIYSNEIKTSITDLIMELDKIIISSNITLDGEGKVEILIKK